MGKFLKFLLGGVAALVIAFSVQNGWSSVFQYRVPVKTSKGERAAYLWISPQAERVRGVVMSGMTLMEREFVKDARIREACRDQQLALMILSCGIGQADLQELLDRLGRMEGGKWLG